MPMRLIVCGCASELPEVDISEFVGRAARDYLAEALRVDTNLFQIASAVHNGSPNPKQVFVLGSEKWLANDTLFGNRLCADLTGREVDIASCRHPEVRRVSKCLPGGG